MIKIALGRHFSRHCESPVDSFTFQVSIGFRGAAAAQRFIQYFSVEGHISFFPFSSPKNKLPVLSLSNSPMIQSFSVLEFPWRGGCRRLAGSVCWLKWNPLYKKYLLRVKISAVLQHSTIEYNDKILFLTFLFSFSLFMKRSMEHLNKGQSYQKT